MRGLAKNAGSRAEDPAETSVGISVLAGSSERDPDLVTGKWSNFQYNFFNTP